MKIASNKLDKPQPNKGLKMTYSNIHQLFEEKAEILKNDIAVVDANKSLSYQQLNEMANKLAHLLRVKGIQPGMVVALCMERSIDVLIAMMATLKVGAAYLPLDINYPKARLDFILEDNHNPFIIIDKQYSKRYENYTGKLFCYDEAAFIEEPKENLNLNLSDRNLAYIIYTSGSTGVPKGVLIEHRNVLHYSAWFAKYAAIKNKNSIDFSSNYIFDMAVTSSIIPLMLGLKIYICQDKVKKNAGPYLKFLAKNKIELIKITPSYLKLLIHQIKEKAIKLPHLKMIVIGGENLPTVDCATWLTHYPHHQIVNEYGPTETTVAVLEQKVISKTVANFGVHIPIGKPSFKMPCYILDEELHPVKVNEIGEIYIGGKSVARGYLNQKELSENKFIKNPFSSNEKSRLYKTGDLGQLLADGSIEYLGRIDDQVKIRGFRVEPAEIELEIAKMKAIKDVIVLPKDNHFGEKYLVAYFIKQNKDESFLAKQIKDYLDERIPSHMIPSFFMELTHFPLTANGKIDKKTLLEEENNPRKTIIVAQTELEKNLVAIWEEELDIRPIGTKDVFFELGGHSLSAARIISKINNLYGQELYLHQFYQMPTINKLATLIDEKKNVVIAKDNERKKLNVNIPKLALGDFQLLLWISNVFAPKAKRFNITGKRHFHGSLDIDALNRAFSYVLHKHEILNYTISKIRPIEKLNSNLSFCLERRNLRSLSVDESNEKLKESLKEFLYLYPWPKNTVQLKATLFELKDNYFELQICLPHMISDDFSADIIFKDLNHYYLQIIENKRIDEVDVDRGYLSFVIAEDKYQQLYIERDLIFWQEYLKNVNLFKFPEEYVVHDMTGKNYSTFVEVPEFYIKNLKDFSLQNHLGFNVGIISAFIKTLAELNPDNIKNNIFINIVKSMRNDAHYDNSLGCFLRLDPLKIKFKKDNNLLAIAKQVRRETINTSPYQRSFSLAKLASLPIFPKSRFKTKFLSAFANVYTKIFAKPKLNKEILRQTLLMTPPKINNEFIINVNIGTGFISDKKLSNSFLGLEQEIGTIEKNDMLNINNVLDFVCIRKEDGKAYIVISANLEPEYRKKIAMNLINNMQVKLKEPIVIE